MRQATSVSRDTLLSLGTCFGKFTKTGKFRLHITALDYVSQHAKVPDIADCKMFCFGTVSAENTTCKSVEVRTYT